LAKVRVQAGRLRWKLAEYGQPKDSQAAVSKDGGTSVHEFWPEHGQPESR